MNRCSKCGKWLYMNQKCSCEMFLVYHYEECLDDPIEMYGVDYDDVAEKYAENFNEEENYVTNDDVFESPIVIEKDGIKKSFNVYAEPKITYCANEIKMVPPPEK